MEFSDKEQHYIPKESLPKCEKWVVPRVDLISHNYHVRAAEPVRLELTQEEIDIVKKAAEVQGREEGYQQGYNEGVQDVKNVVSNLSQILNQVSEPLKDLSFEAENELVNLTIEVAKQVILSELNISEDEVLQVIRQVKEALPLSTRTVTCYCNPADKEIIDNYLVLDQKVRWEIIVDEHVHRGGVRLVTENGQVDATLATRVKEVIASVLNQSPDDCALAELEPATTVNDEALLAEPVAADALASVEASSDLSETIAEQPLDEIVTDEPSDTTDNESPLTDEPEHE